MLVRVLGEVSLLRRDGGAVPLAGPRQRAVLAVLAARAGTVVAVDRLVDLLWGEAAPANPAAAVHSTVFKLRVALAEVTDHEALVTRGAGYLLDLGPGDLDAAVFAALVEKSRDQPPTEAGATLSRALGLWHGDAYSGCEELEPAALEAVRLEEMRRTAVERCAAAQLAAGRPADAVALLRPFVAEHQLREGARATLMQALHATGRTADALDSYQEYRTHLADELGLEPSPALQQTQLALLRSAPAPSASRPDAPSPSLPHGAIDLSSDRTSSRSDRHGLPDLEVRYLDRGSGRVIAYGSTGNGPQLVVSLGWVSSLDVIASGRDPRSSLLERLAGDLSLTLYDRLGSGLSPGPVDDYGLEAAVAELADVVAEVGPPVSLMAMSAAGPVALTLAHRRPDLVDSLVCFGTFADGPRTFHDARMREVVVELVRTHWGVGSKMLADLYRPGLSDEAAWHMAKVFRESATPEVAAAYLEATYPQDVSALLPEIATPTLVLHYRSDRLISFRAGQELAARLPDAVLMPMDGRVHLPDAKDLDTIENAIVAHVTRHASAALAR